MLTNSDCTIYSRKYNPLIDCDEWKKQYIPECWWFVENKSSVTTEGIESADILNARIPDLAVSIKKGDYIVKGNCQFEIETVKDLKGQEYFLVTTANYNGFGSNPHIKVVGV